MTLQRADDETYWDTIRAQYAVSSDFINLENGYFGVQATPVFEAFLRHQTRVNRETSFFLRERFGAELAGAMQALAALCGVDADELLITRNLVEAINILLQGYPFAAGDHVVLAAHDYDSVADTLAMVSRRKQLAVSTIGLPLDPDSDAQIVALYEGAITPATRVMLLTHMVHRSGQIMPVAKIAAMARRHGVDVIVDAAHSFAQLDYTLPALGADFVAVNLHKWLGAPLGMGLLYIRRPRIADIAPLYGDVRVGDVHCAPDAIGKLGHFGTVPPAPIMTIGDAIAFHRQIGAANKEARLRFLKEYWLAPLRALARVRVLTPSAPERACAIAALRIDGIEAREVVRRLMDEHRIFTVVRVVDGFDAVRVTPHLYTSLRELDALVAALRHIAA